MDSKREQIVAGALRRFMHYGINKTTMNEIADDLSMSKPSLYYYFPDKSALVLAVAEKIIGEYWQAAEGIFKEELDFEKSMLGLIDFKYEFLKKYFMLHLGTDAREQFKNEKMLCLVHDLKLQECEMIADKLDVAHADGRLCVHNPKAVAELFLDAMIGLRMFLQLERVAIPDDESFERLHLKQKQLAEIFINGIKCNTDGTTDSK